MNKKILSGFISLLSSTLAYAEYENNDLYNAQLSFGWAPIVTISAGPTWAVAGENQRIYYPDWAGNIIYADYFANKSYNLGASGNVFFALQRTVWPGILAQVGLEAGGTSSFNLHGTASSVAISDGTPGIDGIIVPAGTAVAMPPFSYQYKLSHAEVGIQTKFIAMNTPYIQPYITGIAGIAFNNSHSFSYNTQFNPPPFFYTPWYQKNTVTAAFTYSLGAGIQTTVCRNWQLGAGYLFSDLGKGSLGPDSVNVLYTANTSLHTTHAYAHQLQFSVGYLWDYMP